MKRSFHLHVFLITLMGVLLFLIASRFTVRYFADDFLLNYFNETLAHHTAREIDEAGPALNVKEMAHNLAKTLDDLQPGELMVTLDGANFERPEITWKPLSKQTKQHPVDASYITLNERVWSVLRTPVDRGNQQLYVAVQRQVLERSLEEVLSVRNDIAYKIMPFLLVFCILCSGFISYSSFSPVSELQRAFARIHIHQRGEHISTRSNYKEFAKFIHYFNALIDRLRDNYEQAARFSSDVSHELRTPLTIMRGHIDRLLHQAPDNSDLQRKLALVGEEVERLISITNKLLMLARADAGKLMSTPTRINFSDMLAQKVDDLSLYGNALHITRRITPKISLQGDEDLIEQLLTNLFDNAVKYNVPQGVIHVSAQTHEHRVQLCIENTTYLALGTGLDERVFERFYRHRETRKAFGNDATGSGLGLSLCREIVKAHGGTIHLRQSPRQIVSFEINLPLD